MALTYAIVNDDDHSLWWNNDDGWVDEDHEPTLFSEADRAILNLPDSGKWVPVRI